MRSVKLKHDFLCLKRERLTCENEKGDDGGGGFGLIFNQVEGKVLTTRFTIPNVESENSGTPAWCLTREWTSSLYQSKQVNNYTESMTDH